MTQDVFSFPQILGYVAMAMWIGSLSLKSDRLLNQVWIVSNVIWLTHYTMLGAYVGAANVLINIIRSVLYLIKDWRQSRYKMHVFWGLVAAFLLSSAITYQHWSDVFPLLASVGTCVAFFLLTGLRGRVLLLFANLGWLFYAVVHGSYGGMIGSAAAFLVTLVTIFRLWRDERAAPPAPDSH